MENEVGKSQQTVCKGGNHVKYRKLRGRITEVYGTQKAFAAAMGITDGTLSLKLSGGSEWNRQEIKKACELLGIPIENAHFYFFAE